MDEPDIIKDTVHEDHSEDSPAVPEPSSAETPPDVDRESISSKIAVATGSDDENDTIEATEMDND